MNSYTAAAKNKNAFGKQTVGTNWKLRTWKYIWEPRKGLGDFSDGVSQDGFILLKSNLKRLFIVTVSWRMCRVSLPVT